jgi:hypothetical protein
MPRIGFEHTTPVLKRAKTVHALDGAATVIGVIEYTISKCILRQGEFNS